MKAGVRPALERLRARLRAGWPPRATAARVSGRFLLGALVVAIGGVAFSLGEPDTMLSASLHTEVASIEVVNPPASAIALPAATLLPNEAGESPVCLKRLLVEPAAGARVNYVRPRGGALTVEIDGPVQWGTASDAPKARRDGRTRFEVSKEGSCAAGERVRLPIDGVAVFGEDQLEVTSGDALRLALLSGRLALYGRSIVGFDLGPLKAKALYFAQEMPLPGGSRIAAARKGEGHGAAADGPSNWYGLADVDLGAQGPGAITVEASTNARLLELYPPAPFWSARGSHGSRPDVVSLSLVARLTGDPNLLWLYGLAALVGTALGLISHFWQPAQR